MSSTLANYAICNQCFQPAVNHIEPHEDYYKCAEQTTFSNQDNGTDFPIREFFDFDDNPNWIAYFQKGDDDRNILFYADNMSPTDSAPTVDDFKNDPSLHAYYRSLQEEDLSSYHTSLTTYMNDSNISDEVADTNNVHAQFANPEDYYSYKGAPIFDKFTLSESQVRYYDSNGNADGFTTVQPLDPHLNKRAALRTLNIFYNAKKQSWFIGALKWDQSNKTIMCINPACHYHNVVISYDALFNSSAKAYTQPLTEEDYRRVQEDVTYSLIRHGNNCSLAKNWNTEPITNRRTGFVSSLLGEVFTPVTTSQRFKRGYDLEPLATTTLNTDSIELTDEEFKQHYLNCYSRTCICSRLILDSQRAIVLEELTSISKSRSTEMTQKAKVNGLHPTSIIHNYDLALAYASSTVRGTSPTGGLYIS